MNECRPLFLGHEKLGDRYDKEGIFAFFGTTRFTEKQMDRCFPELQRLQNKQIHSGIVHKFDKAQDETLEGDALITEVAGLALTVYTADCLPILIYDPSQRSVAAIHAGWRGLENLVISNTLNALKVPKFDCLRVWIGPHIKRDSFEVGLDVAERLQNCAPKTSCVLPHPKSSERKLVDLNAIALSQFSSLGVGASQIWTHPANTLTDPMYPSFRRDGKGGRLLSFIALSTDM